MEENRKYPRVRTGYQVRLTHRQYGYWVGSVANMSEGGIFVAELRPSEFTLGLEIDATILGEGWDKGLPALRMKVIRIEEKGIALAFVEPDYPLWDSGKLSESTQSPNQ